MIGGGCINIACIPTKTMVASAEVAHTVRHSATYGVNTSALIVALATVIERKRSVVEAARAANLHLLETALAHDLIISTARFVAPKTIEVTTAEDTVRHLTADRLFINTGTRPLISSVPRLKETGFLTSASIMELEQLPEHLIVLGSGYIGLEFALANSGGRSGSQSSGFAFARRCRSRTDYRYLKSSGCGYRDGC